MATKILFTSMVDRFSSVALRSRRGYAATAIGSVNNLMGKKIIGEGKTKTTPSWVPDPITGFYRPENRSAGEVDVAQLPEILLQKSGIIRPN
ncbi:late embryogenis abundant protein 2-like [Impatiens glandulifera]|uniref:late embryogenis abundant protein 2-like n=1 Tax=Impatiens glandulifera TaxID=253017 RepID=UPI001FB16E26|nr:late embryogenis abundant protein 2-like [Impatiens glandulifera]